jgi:lincosamide and streptogramin A transport system ATP-binding/permease protein
MFGKVELKVAARRASSWAAKGESKKIGYDPVKEHDRSIGTRAFISAKTKKMQNRVKQINGRIQREIEEKEGLLNDIEEIADIKLISLKHHKEVLCRIKDYGLKYIDGEEFVFENFNLEIRQGDRVFLNGSNGCGKSSLIKALIKDCINRGDVVEKGVIETASGIIISYVNQDTSHLKGTIEEFSREQGLDRTLFQAILRQLDMERLQFTKNIEDFSEGQKKKVLIAASLSMRAHLYIWDEPLNYIDVYSRMQIEKLIEEYKPTMLIVEHDVMFREKIATKVVDM